MPKEAKRKQVPAQEIIDKINKAEDVIYENVDIIGDLDFTKVTNRIKDNIGNTIYEIKGQLKFIDCKFENKVISFSNEIGIIQYISFSKETLFVRVHFLGVVDFSRAKFLGKVDFQDTKFSKIVYFKGTEFYGNVRFGKGESDRGEDTFSISEIEGKSIFFRSVYFNNAKFFGKANFWTTIFSNESDFSRAEFSGKSIFVESTFKGDVYFEETKFLGIAFFTKATFKKDVYFLVTNFLEDCFFTKSKFYKNAIFSYILVEKTITFQQGKTNKKHINLIKIEHVSPKGTITFIDFDLSKTTLLYSTLNNFKFANVTWGEDKRAILADQNNLKDENLGHIERLYRQLKVKFKKDGNNKLSDDFFYGELEMKLKQKKYIFKIFSWERWYKLFSNFGTNWWLPIIWIVGFILLFSSISWLEAGGVYNKAIYHKYYDLGSQKYIVAENLYNNLYLPNNKVLTNELAGLNIYLQTLAYHTANAFFIPQKVLEPVGFWTIIISRIENVIVTALLVLAGFAIRRKFRT